MVNYWVLKITKGGQIPVGGGYNLNVKEGYEKYVSRKYAQSFAEEYRKYGIECEVVPLNEITGKEKFNNVKKHKQKKLL